MHLPKPNRSQIESLKRLYERSPDTAPTYLAFRRRFRVDTIIGAFCGRWCGMFVGIEADGRVSS